MKYRRRLMLVLTACLMFVLGTGMASVDFGQQNMLLEDIDLPETLEGDQSELESKDPKYYIYVEKGSYTLTVYAKDSDGEYTKRVKSFRVAIGKNNRTPSGKFKILGKERWHAFSAGSYAQYASRFTGSLYVHSPLYGSKDIYDMWPNYYYEIGSQATSGCLRTHCAAAYWIYRNCEVGTVVEIVSGNPKKTSSSGAPALNANNKKYDPTDPNVKLESNQQTSRPSITWKQENGNWVCYDSAGKKLLGWQHIGLEWYYLGTDGVMQTGWSTINGKSYYLTDSGAMADYFRQIDGEWYYFGTDGAMRVGWHQDDGLWYYMDTNGIMLSEQWIDDEYYLTASGAMVAGRWLRSDQGWHYMLRNGSKARGWHQDGKDWYLMDDNGLMLTGLVQVRGHSYLLSDSGRMYTGWLDASNAWYYFTGSGAMAQGWKQVKNVWYYFLEDGTMVTGQLEIDGTMHSFSGSGAWIQ